MRIFDWAACGIVAGLALLIFAPIGIRAADQDTRISTAVKSGDKAVLRSLLKQRADVNAREADGSTALLWAVHMSDLETAELLIGAGADVKVANRYGLTPILEASRLGNTPLIQALLKAGADPNIALPQGETPLMAAAGAGNVEAVKLFIARGANVNAKEQAQNQTALMWAANEGHAPVVKALLEAGADVNAVAKPASLSRVPLGDQGRSWVVHATGGLTALMFAARQGQLDAARTLADGGADLNRANPDGLTALILAVINDRLDVAAMLVDKGANVNDGSLYEVIQLHNLPAVETNLDATRPRPTHANTVTPLDLIARMVARGADPNRVATHTLYGAGSGGGGSAGIINPANQSPFARALAAQDVAVLRLLLTKGANPNAPTDGGALPLTLAMGGGGGGRGGPPGGRGGAPSPLRFPSDRTPAEAVKVLLEAGADVNAANAAGDTPLHAAAQGGNVAMIQLLADRGATLDVQNRAGLTPLDLAMGKQAPGANAGPGRGAPGGAGGRGRGGPPGPQPQAIVLLRQLMGLPPLSPAEMPAAAPARGGPPPFGGN